MNVRRIVPIVEGHGEVRAVPSLIRRWLRHRRLHRTFVVPDLAINAKGSGRLKAAYDRMRHIGIEHYVSAALGYGPDAIVVVLDADDECLDRPLGNGLGPELLGRARAVANDTPLAVVVANREYEAWFLASLTSIRAADLLPNHTRLANPLAAEGPRDCKGLIAQLLDCPYEETLHQLALTHGITFSPRAKFRSPSYGKLLRDLERLVNEARSFRSVA